MQKLEPCALGTTFISNLPIVYLIFLLPWCQLSRWWGWVSIRSSGSLSILCFLFSFTIDKGQKTIFEFLFFYLCWNFLSAPANQDQHLFIIRCFSFSIFSLFLYHCKRSKIIFGFLFSHFCLGISFLHPLKEINLYCLM